ncbi:BTB/POZ domain-containing protein At1g30440-like isoform X1 [Phragmites australis]|uniref:BTB/POZ domain-containing protein At1g30440-like isoform X1 n=1 Tax=Phragmites australis TaxID=29695 RepID=UPI002D77A396|nr:BTB/POZ domain-containing protein At1g30440-like isoform X1 [Phragmites australis]XP_062192387.1 BTB/POZ domain-containing protein At1g30440-like isoform X1 [Phragmites australis]
MFPLLSKSDLLERHIREKIDKGEDSCVIDLSDIPGGARSFELAAKFCYGLKFEMTSSNVVHLRCAADYLEMTEEMAKGNLIAQTENFLTQTVLRSWKDSIKVLHTCDDVLDIAERLKIIKRCVDSIATKSCSDPDLFVWPVVQYGGPMQSPGGSLLWNGISKGARPRNSSPDWWYDDVSCLSLSLYKKVISAMEYRGISQDIIVGSLNHYAKRRLPSLNRRKSISDVSNCLSVTTLTAIPSEEEQKYLLEEIDRLLPFQRGVTSCKLLFGLLRTAVILKASPSCLSNLERRIGLQLDKATLEDLLIPNISESIETLYDVDCVQRIVDHFLAMDQETGGASSSLGEDGHILASPSLMPITMVAKLIDGYLAEVAPDVNLKLPKFRSLAAAIPDYACPIDDGLYRAIDIYLKAHPHLSESEKEELCRVMDCQKLSLEACTHAAQNERLPLRVIVQVLFLEQLQLRSSIAECLMVSEPLEGGGSRQLGLPISGEHHCAGWPLAARENQILREGMDSMKQRVAELQKECSTMKGQIERLGCSRSAGKSWFPFPLAVKPQICSTKEAALETAAAASEDKLAVVKAGTGTGTGSGGTPQLMHSPSPRLFF